MRLQANIPNYVRLSMVEDMQYVYISVVSPLCDVRRIYTTNSTFVLEALEYRRVDGR